MTNEHETCWLLGLVNSDDIVLGSHHNVFDGGGDFLLLCLCFIGFRCLLCWVLYGALCFGVTSYRLFLGLFSLLLGDCTKGSVLLVVESFFVCFNVLSSACTGSICWLLVCLIGSFFILLSLGRLCVKLVKLGNHAIWQTFSGVVSEDKNRLL